MNEFPETIDGEKVEYGRLQDMYAYVSRMNVDKAVKHGKNYFGSLGRRTAPFIRTLKDEKFFLAQKMKDYYDIFLNNVYEKLDKETELWQEITTLKTRWKNFQKTYDKIKEEDYQMPKSDKVVMERSNSNHLQVIWIDSILNNNLAIDFKGSTCFALMKQSFKEENHSIESLRTHLINLLEEMKDDTCFVTSKRYQLPLIECRSQLAQFWSKVEKNSIITEVDCLLNLTRDSENFRPMKLKKFEDVLILEAQKTPEEEIQMHLLENLHRRLQHESTHQSDFSSLPSTPTSTSTSSSSTSLSSNGFEKLEDIYETVVCPHIRAVFEEFLPKFQKCTNSESLFKLFISLKEEMNKIKHEDEDEPQLVINMVTELSIKAVIHKKKPLEIYQCCEYDIKPKNRDAVKIYFTTQIHAFNHIHSSSNKSVEEPQTTENKFEPVGCFNAKTPEEIAEMFLNYKLSGINSIRMLPKSLKDIPIDEYMRSEMKEKVENGTKMIENNLEKILMNYKKCGSQELKISQPNDIGTPLPICAQS